MTRQGNILSFDEAKAHGTSRSDVHNYSRNVYGSRASSVPRSSRTDSRRSSRNSFAEFNNASRSRSSAVSSRGTRGRVVSQSQVASSERSSLSTDYPARREARRGVPLQGQHLRSEQTKRRASERTSSRTTNSRRTQPARSSQRLRKVDHSSALKEAQREDYLADREKRMTNEEEQPSTTRKQKKSLSQRLRGFKASRAYNKVFGSKEAPQQETSRAALYEMRMGRTHRRSSRMQDDNGKDKTSSSRSFSPLALIGSFASSQRATRVFLCVCGVVFACIMLYGPCASYYNEVRSVQQLEAEYQALQDYNNDMQSQIDYLNTEEGMEEYIRSELGWIRSDEHMMQVEGLDSAASSDDDSSNADSLTTVPTDSVKAPSTWYSGVLDVLFGYQG